MKIAGLIHETDLHHLDHIAPLCKILDCPLLVTDPAIVEAANNYYPNLLIEYYPTLEAPEHIVQNFDLIFSCYPRPLIDELLFFPQTLLKKKVSSVWVPHGNSDKGRNSLFMEGLQNESLALIYGKQMGAFLKEKDVFAKTINIGNYRYNFYKEHVDFYKNLVKKEILNKLKCGKVILYAPTWQDRENSSSFVSACPLLLENLPMEYSMIVKPHPNLFKQQGEFIEELIAKYAHQPNILFLNHFPPIYPLLDHVDIYIGDMSSIGYDFITFNRPLFFLNENKKDPDTDLGFFLAKCGIVIEKEDYATIYEKIKDNLEVSAYHKEIQKQIYKYTFGTIKNLNRLKDSIEQKISRH